jgi:hypothetical protein
MAKEKPSHHPPVPGIYQQPKTNNINYIFGDQAIAGFGNREFYVACIPRAQAVEIIIKHHYSRRIVNNSFIHLGVFLDGVLRGVLQYGYALNPRCADKIVAGTQIGEYLELNRMWMDDIAPRNSESRAISYSIKYIKKACPSVAWIQSFADERCGALGVVYQAANFYYFGSHWTTFFELDGDTYHDMLLTAHKKGGNRGIYLRANIDRAIKRRFRQFRYIYFIKRQWIKRCKVAPLTYPKPNAPLLHRRDKKYIVLL